MSQDGYKTMRVPVDAWQDAKDAKAENETWGEYLMRCTDNPPEITELVEADSTGNLEGVESSLRVIEERTNKIERMLDRLE